MLKLHSLYWVLTALLVGCGLLGTIYEVIDFYRPAIIVDSIEIESIRMGENDVNLIKYTLQPHEECLLNIFSIAELENTSIPLRSWILNLTEDKHSIHVTIDNLPKILFSESSFMHVVHAKAKCGKFSFWSKEFIISNTEIELTK